MAQVPKNEAPTYGAAVTFDGHKCWFWTGDVGFTAADFLRDLKGRFDRRGAIVIRHAAGVPARCVEQAIRAGTRAGFRQVKAVVDVDAGPIGPPLDGR